MIGFGVFFLRDVTPIRHISLCGLRHDMGCNAFANLPTPRSPDCRSGIAFN